MTKLFIFLFTLTLAAISSMWFIENDGSIIVQWLGYRVQTSVAFAVLSSVVILVFLTTLLQFLLFIKATPKRYKKAITEKRRENGLTALTNGFAAIAAGDIKESKRLTKQATGYLGNIPLTKLLSAQTAQLEGNKELAKVHYTAMLESKETESIAIKGLMVQARKDGDFNKAIFLAEKAISLNPNAAWAIAILMDLYKITKNWLEAEKIIQKAKKVKVLSTDEANRSLALVYLGICKDLVAKGNYDEATKYVQKSYGLQSALAPVVLQYAKLLLQNDNNRKAAKIIEKCWKILQHPSLAHIYNEIYINENGDKRIKRAERLLNIAPNSLDGHISVAKVAMSVGNLSKARNHLKVALSISETKSICSLMAELERLEDSGSDVVDQWRQRSVTSNPDHVWSCKKCGSSTNDWSLNCENCESFDSLQWTSDANSKIKIMTPEPELLQAS